MITFEELTKLSSYQERYKHFGELSAQSYEWQLQRDYGKIRDEFRQKYLEECALIVERNMI